jgi:hypothetical protein
MEALFSVMVFLWRIVGAEQLRGWQPKAGKESTDIRNPCTTTLWLAHGSTTGLNWRHSFRCRVYRGVREEAG